MSTQPVNAAATQRHPLLSFLGLALGLACLLSILLYVRSELGYDRFHERADRIYRVSQALEPPNGEVVNTVFTQLIMAPTLDRDFPEIAEVARLLPWAEGTLPGKVAVRYGREKQSYELFAWADESLPRIFTLPVVEGEAATLLKEPNTVALSESTARRIFGDEPAVGKVLRIDSGYSDEDYRVTAVLRDLPYNSHFHFHILASYSSLDHVADPRIIRDNWWANDAYTYVLLAEGVSAAELESRFPAFVEKYYPPIPGASAAIHLQPLRDIHLHSHQFGEIEQNGDVRHVYIAAGAAVFTFLIVCLNFLVLSPPRRSFQRALAEAAGAMVLALVIVRLALPFFNGLLGKQATLPYTWPSLLAVAALVLFVTVLAAGPLPRMLTGAGLRRGLAVVELAAAMALLVGAFAIRDQIRFMRSQEPGFEADDVLVVPIRDNGVRDDFAGLKAALARHPDVLGTTFSSLLVGTDLPQMGGQFGDSDEFKLLDTLMADWDFPAVFEVPLAAGRALTGEETDRKSGFLINESALPLVGARSPQEAIGKKAVWNGFKAGTIVGVVRDFHFQSLQHRIEPMLIHVRPIVFRYLYIRFAPGKAEGVIRHLESTWRGMVADKPLEHFLLADELGRAYAAEERLRRLVATAGLLALLFACLGLLGLPGLAAATAGRRLPGRLKEATALVAVAGVIALPVAYLVVTRWLEPFAYPTEVTPVSFLLGGLVVLAAAWLAAGYGALREAL